MLTQELLKQHLSYDPGTGVFTRLLQTSNNIAVGCRAGFVGQHGYRRISVLSKQYLEHRLAWLYTHGKWPEKYLDHIDGNPENNKIANLRQVSQKENMRNSKRQSNNTSGHKGVHWCAKERKWKVVVVLDKHAYCGGFYNHLEAAAIAVKALRTKLHGEYANHG